MSAYTTFQPLGAGTRSNTSYYRDLSEHSFCPGEKAFLVKQILCEDEKDLEIAPTCKKAGKVTISGVCQRYHLPNSTVRRWVDKVQHGEVNESSLPGRRPDIDDIAKDDIKCRLFSKEMSVTPLTKSETGALLVEMKKETIQRRKGNICVQDITMCNNTMEAVKKAIGVRNRKAQSLTNARLKAMSDIRVTYKTAVGYQAYAADLPPENKFNADCTTFIVKPNGAGGYVCVVRDKGATDSQVTSVNTPSDLDLLVKYFGLGNAAGEVSPPAMIVAVGTMPENTYFAMRLKGLSHSTAVGESGWLYLTKTKGGCAEMWKHWFMNIYIPFIKSSNAFHKNKVVIHIVSYSA